MARKRRVHVAPLEEDGQNYLASVSDLICGLLFIFIITLILFSLRLKGTQQDLRVELERQKAENVRLVELQTQAELESNRLREEKKRLEAMVEQLAGSKAVRERMLEEVRTALADSGCKVEIDLEHGILRLPEEVLFPSGSDQLQPEGRKTLATLAGILEKVLPPYVEDTPSVQVGDSSVHMAKVDAIFIEGHTDNIPIRVGGTFKDNWDLSAARAIRTFKTLVESTPTIDLFKSEFEQPLFSVSGYADRRPISSNDDEVGRRKNRRIDLRFIMSPPKLTPDVVKAVEGGLNATAGQ